MSLRNGVLKAVDKAFNAVGDLKVRVEVTRANISGFNFGTGETTLNPVSSIVAFGVLLARRKSDELTKLGAQTLLLKVSDVADLFVTDTITINTVPWKIIPPLESTEYLHTATVMKGQANG